MHQHEPESVLTLSPIVAFVYLLWESILYQLFSHLVNVCSSFNFSLFWLPGRFRLLRLPHRVSQAVAVLLASTLKVWYWCDCGRPKNVNGWISSWLRRTTDDRSSSLHTLYILIELSVWLRSMLTAVWVSSAAGSETKAELLPLFRVFVSMFVCSSC